MGAIRNVTDEAKFLPLERATIGAGEVLEVPDDRVYAYTASSNFEPVGSESKALHAQAEQDEAERVEAEVAARRAQSGIEDQPDAGTDDQGDSDPVSDPSSSIAGGPGPETITLPAGTVVDGPVVLGSATNVETGESTPAGDPLPEIQVEGDEGRPASDV